MKRILILISPRSRSLLRTSTLSRHLDKFVLKSLESTLKMKRRELSELRKPSVLRLSIKSWQLAIDTLELLILIPLNQTLTS